MVFSLVSLLLIGLAAAYYLTGAQPELTDNGGYQKLQEKANAAAAMLQKNPQAEVDAATAPPASTASTTNAAPSGN